MLSACIGEIDDFFLEEADTADIASIVAKRKRIKKYSTLAAAASFGVAVTVWLVKNKRVASA